MKKNSHCKIGIFPSRHIIIDKQTMFTIATGSKSLLDAPTEKERRNEFYTKSTKRYSLLFQNCVRNRTFALPFAQRQAKKRAHLFL